MGPVNTNAVYCYLIVFGATAPNGPGRPHSRGFLDHKQRRTTVGRTPQDEWSARRRDLYLTTHNTHNKNPCPRWYSNPQSRQASGCRPTPYTARPLGPARWSYQCLLLLLFTLSSLTRRVRITVKSTYQLCQVRPSPCASSAPTWRICVKFNTRKFC